jgi:predicted helicase
LQKRWMELIGEQSIDRKRDLFKVTRDKDITSDAASHLGGSTSTRTITAETGPCPAPHRIGYRSFDRQWIIPDERLIDFPRLPLWAAERHEDELFIVEQHSTQLTSGPGVVITNLIPDMNYFNGRGGRVFPLFHPDGSANTATNLLAGLGELIGTSVSAGDLLAYVAAVAAHPAFTARFAEELVTPGIRVPLTGDADLFAMAVTLGRQLIWAATYGAAFADPSQGRPLDNIAYPASDPRRVRNLTPIGGRLPETITYDKASETIRIGNGSFGPVPERVWTYDVGGMKIIQHWFDYRKANPGGRRSSALDDIHVQEWPIEWVREFNELLTALRRISDLEPDQADLLDRIIGGPTITRADLASEGVRPAGPRDRRPRYGPHDARNDQENTLL